MTNSLSFIGDVPISLKILKTDQEKQNGFMGYPKSPEDSFGMCFYNDHPKIQSFWMKNVSFDLDILGFDENDDLVEIMQLVAGDETPKTFSKPVKHVVELRKNWCSDYNIGPNTKLHIG